MVIDGATGAAVTVSVATLLVTLPAELLTTTVNCAPRASRFLPIVYPVLTIVRYDQHALEYGQISGWLARF